jgi:ribosomal protein L7Ae-like RNA K-turn-binding protein
VDLKARLPGRGAWVHPDSGCLERLETQPKLLTRALRGAVRTDGLADAVRDAVKQALLHGLSQAAAGGHLIGGHDRLIAALHAGGLSWVVLASDAAERTAASVRAAAVDMPVVVVPLDRESLGRQVGQASRAALGVGTTPACAYLRRQLHRWRNLG